MNIIARCFSSVASATFDRHDLSVAISFDRPYKDPDRSKRSLLALMELLIFSCFCRSLVDVKTFNLLEPEEREDNNSELLLLLPRDALLLGTAVVVMAGGQVAKSDVTD